MTARMAAGTVLLVLLVGVMPAIAANAMAGRWRASSGFTVIIPDSTGSFELVFDRSDGRVKHPAQWVEVGKKFTWTDKVGSKHQATLDPKDSNKICDVNEAYPDSRAYWYRIRN